jgi:hypothetical protein
MRSFFTFLSFFQILYAASENSKYGTPEEFKNTINSMIGEIELKIPQNFKPFVD